MDEKAKLFKSGANQLVGILHYAKPTSSSGVVIVVGGPQTRVGSHRQFVLLARFLAEQGIHVFRFDYTGAGDSAGKLKHFTEIPSDISAAIACFKENVPELSQITLWGLCDAASAMLMLQAKQPHPLVKNLVLLNPWVRQTHTQAQTFLKRYYVKRLLSVEFWQKLLTGKINHSSSIADMRNFKQQSNAANVKHSFVDEMRQGFAQFDGNIQIILSGDDLTADEFSLLIKTDKHWQTAVAKNNIQVTTVKDANHTFASEKWRKEVELITFQAINDKL